MQAACTPNAANDTEPSRGVFWVIDGKLSAYPFCEGSRDGIAKSGDTYNHRKLWAALNMGSEPYNYHPRGRVDVTNEGIARLFVNPNIDTDAILPEIKRIFSRGYADDADSNCCILKRSNSHGTRGG